MGQGQACCTFKLKSLINSVTAWIPPGPGWLGKPPNVFCTMSNKTGGCGYSVHNGAMGEARVPSTMTIVAFFFFFASRMGVFWLFSAMTRFFF